MGKGHRYRYIYQSGGRITAEHRLVIEAAIGGPIPPGAEIHHKNGDKLDNRLENLVICKNVTEHRLLHRKMAALAACGNEDWRKCKFCRQYDDPANLYIGKDNCYHQRCYNAWRTARKFAMVSEAPYP